VDESLLYQCKENLKGIIEKNITATANMAYAAYILQLMQHPMKDLATKLRTAGKNAKSTVVSLNFLSY
jgi:enoyl reductase-like protein